MRSHVGWLLGVLAVAVAAAWAVKGTATQEKGGADGSSPQRPLALSLVQLIATPERYDGKFVRVWGYVKLEHEGSAVYLHKEDFEQALTRNGLWLTGPEHGEVSDCYALVEGRFDAKDQGHRSLWSGAIDRVSRLQRWEGRVGRK
jgi:hypothetical protein